MVKRTRRHRATDDPQPAVDDLEPVQVEFPLNAGRDIPGGSSQIIRRSAVGRWEEWTERVVVWFERVVTVQHFDEEGACLRKAVSSPCPVQSWQHKRTRPRCSSVLTAVLSSSDISPTCLFRLGQVISRLVLGMYMRQY